MSGELEPEDEPDSEAGAVVCDGAVAFGFQPWSCSPESVLLFDSLMILTSPVVVVPVVPVVAVVGGATVGFVITGRAGADLLERRVRFFFFVCASPAIRPTVSMRQTVIKILLKFRRRSGITMLLLSA